MTRQNKGTGKHGPAHPARASGATQPRQRQQQNNPGLEVVNIYGSGPLPVGLRSEAEPATGSEVGMPVAAAEQPAPDAGKHNRK
jgi:hypothetical protein